MSKRWIRLFVMMCGMTVTWSSAQAYYNPQAGRFIQRDPLGYVDGMNMYEYVMSKPGRGLDPTGLSDVLTSAQPLFCKCAYDKIVGSGNKAAREAYTKTKNYPLPPNAVIEGGASTGPEHGGWVCCNAKTGAVEITGPVAGPLKMIPLGNGGAVYVGEEVNLKSAPTCASKGMDWQDAGMYHSHPASIHFSEGDWNLATVARLPSFLGHSQGASMLYPWIGTLKISNGNMTGEIPNYVAVLPYNIDANGKVSNDYKGKKYSDIIVQPVNNPKKNGCNK